jgi:hypothetical protein
VGEVGHQWSSAQLYNGSNTIAYIFYLLVYLFMKIFLVDLEMFPLYESVFIGKDKPS